MKLWAQSTSGNNVRYAFALLLAATLAWEYLRDANAVSSLAVWMLLVHFVYFQLPFKSRATAFFHSISFIGAFSIPVLYLYLLYYRPNMEEENMESWNITWDAALLRTFLIHFAPLICHTADLTSNRDSIIQQYRLKPRRLMYVFPAVSFLFLTFIHEFSFPEPDEATSMDGISREKYLQSNNVISLLSLACAYAVLHQLILKLAFDPNNTVFNNNILESNNGQQQQPQEQHNSNISESSGDESSSVPTLTAAAANSHRMSFGRGDASIASLRADLLNSSAADDVGSSSNN